MALAKGRGMALISKSHKGKPAWNKGKPMSEEQKKKISEARKKHLELKGA